MKKLFATMLMVAGLSAYAASPFTLATTGASTNNVLQGSLRITDLTFTAGASAVTLSLFDSSSTNLTFAVGGWTYYSNYVGNVTNVYTTSTGVGVTNVVSNVLLTTTNTFAGYTNALPKLVTITVPANTTTTFSVPIEVTRGLTITNNAAVTVSGNYSRSY